MIFFHMQKENGERFYPTQNITLRPIAVAVLSMYNQRAMYLDEIYDSKFVYFLALEVLMKERIICEDIQKHRVDFAERLFKIRLENQPRADERLERFNTLLIERINDIKFRHNENQKQKAELNRIQN